MTGWNKDAFTNKHVCYFDQIDIPNFSQTFQDDFQINDMKFERTISVCRFKVSSNNEIVIYNDKTKTTFIARKSVDQIHIETYVGLLQT